jgi:hypothetical protein
MQKGRGGLGSRKHGISGRSGKGPALRLWLDMMARRQEVKDHRRKLRYETVREAIQKDRPNR